MTRLEACLFLRHIAGIGMMRSHKLLAYFETPEAIFACDFSNPPEIEGLGTNDWEALKQWKTYRETVDNDLKSIEKHGITPLLFGTSDYPKTLTFCPDAPLVLFLKGKIHFPKRKIISIVGTRSNTQRGKDFCCNFIEAIAPFDPIICSGFALGIDIIAHQTANYVGLQTVACIGNSLDQPLYPAQHRVFERQLMENGGFLSDFTSSEPFDKSNFPRRNRIIAGLGHATLVIESGIKGGSMYTAHLAHQYGRELFAVPGRPTDEMSQGCLHLIEQQKAQLLFRPEDFIAAMGWGSDSTPLVRQKEIPLALSEDEQRLFDYFIQNEKGHLDALSLALDWPIQKTASLMMQLEMKGHVRALPGKYFEWI